MIKRELISGATSVLTGSYAIANIQDVLSIVILILSIANLLWQLIWKIYNRVKNKEFDKIDDDIDETIDNLTDLKGGNKK